MLGNQIIAHGFGRQIFAKARLLEAAVRRFRGERQVVVYPHGAEAQIGGKAHGAGHIGGEHG